MAGTWRELVLEADPDLLGRLEMLKVAHNINDEAMSNAVLAVTHNSDGVLREADYNRIQRDILRQAGQTTKIIATPAKTHLDISQDLLFSKDADLANVQTRSAPGSAHFDFNPAGLAPQTQHYDNQVKWQTHAIQQKLATFKELYRHEYTLEDRVTKHSETPVTVVGRIVTLVDGPVDPEHWMLEMGHSRIKLNIERLTGYCIFQGQLVIVTGTSDSDSFYVQEIRSGVSCPYKRLTESESEEYNFEIQHQPLRTLIARGPFTGKEDFKYKALSALANYVKTNRCHTLILLGPFIDTRHELVQRGVCQTIGNELEGTFEDCYEALLTYFEDNFPACKVVLVPSLFDAFCDYPLPQPSRPHRTIKIMENPCSLTINGLQVSIANYDILKEILSQSTFRSSVPINKNSIAVSQLLEQQSLMPLTSGFPIDWRYSNHFTLHYSPDLLIIGSSLGNHFQEVNNTFSVFAKPCSARELVFYDLTVVSGSSPLPDRVVARACSLKL